MSILRTELRYNSANINPTIPKLRDLESMKTGKVVPTASPAAEKQLQGFIDNFEPDHQALIRAMRKALRKRMPSANELVWLPKGTKLMTIAYFDNSKDNFQNPDPSKAVRWGEPSDEEMMGFWLQFADPQMVADQRFVFTRHNFFPSRQSEPSAPRVQIKISAQSSTDPASTHDLLIPNWVQFNSEQSQQSASDASTAGPGVLFARPD